MKIFNFINIKKRGKDQRKAECPYCGKCLEKKPGAKTKCSSCDNYIYVRTNTRGVRLTVTKSEADKIDEEWRIKNGTQEAYLVEKERYRKRKEKLLNKSESKNKISDFDVQWSLLNEDILNYAKKHQWGLYRNTRFQMGEMLRRQNKLEYALGFYLAVCYLDLNGPQNMPLDDSENVVKLEDDIMKPFDQEFSFLAPGVIERIEKIIKKLDLKKKKIEEIYNKFAEKEKKAINPPRSPSECFNEIKRNLIINN
ncbi:MAG: hypothetical protein ACOCUF_01810 [Patescibacteria group bacterium]